MFQLFWKKISTDIELKISFLKSIKTIESYICMLKNKLDQNDLKGSLNKLFSKDSNRRYLVDFYILFQIMQRSDQSTLTGISYDNLQIKMAKVKEQINSPITLEEGKSQQKYFENLLDSISTNNY